MHHEAHWYLSAFIWFISAWYVATRCTEAVTEYADSHAGQGLRTTLVALLAGSLYVSGFGAAYVADRLMLGIFSDMSVWETGTTVTIAAIIGTGCSLALRASSKKEEQR